MLRCHFLLRIAYYYIIFGFLFNCVSAEWPVSLYHILARTPTQFGYKNNNQIVKCSALLIELKWLFNLFVGSRFDCFLGIIIGIVRFISSHAALNLNICICVMRCKLDIHYRFIHLNMYWLNLETGSMQFFDFPHFGLIYFSQFSAYRAMTFHFDGFAHTLGCFSNWIGK